MGSWAGQRAPSRYSAGATWHQVWLDAVYSCWVVLPMASVDSVTSPADMGEPELSASTSEAWLPLPSWTVVGTSDVGSRSE